MNTTISNTSFSRPPITVTQAELARLTRLAEAALGATPEVAEELLFEMDRATVIDSDAVPPGIVGINSIVTYRTDNNNKRRVKLVLPLEADITSDRISILTPIGVALIGLSEGQTMDWKARDGKTHHLTVLRVENGAAAHAKPDGDGPAAA